MRRKVTILFVLVLSAIVLAACGKQSKEEVLEKLHEKWAEGKGYELNATMEIKTGEEPRVYKVNVWHTKPDFYRVQVTQEDDNVTQMIIRNKDGVFVVTPSLKKTYKFQSEWPKQNSQPYLIGALAEDLLADKNVQMEETEDSYIFTAATRNNHKSIMPTQKVTVDKKTFLPKSVSILNEADEEQMRITFKKIDLGMQHKEKEYAVEQFTKEEEPNVAKEKDKESTEFQTHYPVLAWTNTTLVDEKRIENDGTERVILTFEGDKSFTLVQEPIVLGESATIPVFQPGEPVDLGFTIGTLTDHSLTFEKDGISFFIASNDLTKEEMIEVAASITAGSLK